jgi:hypothetical protein
MYKALLRRMAEDVRAGGPCDPRRTHVFDSLILKWSLAVDFLIDQSIGHGGKLQRLMT